MRNDDWDEQTEVAPGEWAIDRPALPRIPPPPEPDPTAPAVPAASERTKLAFDGPILIIGIVSIGMIVVMFCTIMALIATR